MFKTPTMDYKNHDNPFIYGGFDEDDDIFAIATADLCHVPQEQPSYCPSTNIQDNDNLSFLDNIVQIDDLASLMDGEEKDTNQISMDIRDPVYNHHLQISPATSPVRPYRRDDSMFLFGPHTIYEDDVTISTKFPTRMHAHQPPQTPSKTLSLPLSSPGDLHSSYRYHQSNINVTTTPSSIGSRSAIGKVSFVIQSGRVTSESPTSHTETSSSIFNKPSSAKRRLDFQDSKPVVSRSNSIDRSISNVSDIPRRPLIENQQSISISIHNTRTQGKENNSTSLNHVTEPIDKRKRYSIPKDSGQIELVHMRRRPKEYEKFLLNLLNNEEAEDEEDEEDDVYRVASDEYEDDMRTIKKEPIVRVSDREFVALLDDYTDAFVSVRSNNTDHKPLASKSYHTELHTYALDPFTLDQLNALRNQMSKHFQLLVQLFGLGIEISGGDSVAKVALDLLFDLKCRADKSIANIGSLLIVDSIIPAPLCLSMQHYHINDSIFPLSFYSLPHSEFNKLELFRPIYTNLVQQLECRRPLEVQCRTLSQDGIMCDPTQQMLPQSTVRCSYDGPTFILPFKLKHNHISSSGNHNHIILPARLASVLEIFKSDFDPDFELYFLQECQQHRVKFVDAEDRLLLKGLKRFGCSSWDQIQQYYLPGKTQRQIAVRYKNLASRTAPANPIKDFYFEQFLPLTQAEQELLHHGMAKYRGNFQQLSKELLPNRPAAILKRFWTEQYHSHTPPRSHSRSAYLPSHGTGSCSHVFIAPATANT